MSRGHRQVLHLELCLKESHPSPWNSRSTRGITRGSGLQVGREGPGEDLCPGEVCAPRGSPTQQPAAQMEAPGCLEPLVLLPALTILMSTCALGSLLYEEGGSTG